MALFLVPLGYLVLPTTGTIAYTCAVLTGKMCIVPVQAAPEPVQYRALFACGSMASCSARLGVAAATEPKRQERG